MKYNHILPLQIRFNDVDKFGHVNNTVYFQFFDTAKTDYIYEVCPHVDWSREAIMVAHIECDFIAQVMGDDRIAVRTRVSHIGTKSFRLMQEVFDMGTGEVKCRCMSVMVAYDLMKHCSMAIPEQWKEAIGRFENGGSVRQALAS